MHRMEDGKHVPISDQRTLFLVNAFILNTIQFINKFSIICEDKLADVHRKILRLETTVSLLEDKLISVDHLVEVEESAGIENLPDKMSSPLQHSIPTIEATSVHMTTSLGEEKLSSTIKDDPRFSRFFQMLHFGVPEQAVKLQMSIEGYDAALLDEPNASLNFASAAGTISSSD